MSVIIDEIWFFGATALVQLVFFYIGYIILHFLPNSNQFPLLLKFSISYGLGTGFNGIFMFFSIIAGINSRFSFIPLIIVTLFLGFFFKINKKFLNDIAHVLSSIKNKIMAIIQKRKKYHPLIWVCFILFGIEAIYLFFTWLIEPNWGWDAVAIWDAHARFIFFDGNLNYVAQNATPHDSYPILLPLNLVFFYSVYLQPQYYALIMFYSYFYCILILIYYSLRKIGVNNNKSLLITALIALNPEIYYNATTGYADLTLTFFYCAGIIFMCFYISTKNKSFLIYSALFHGFMSWTRPEGIEITVVDFTILVGYHVFSLLKSRNREMANFVKQDLIWFSYIIVIYLPWLIICAVDRVNEQNLSNISILLNSQTDFSNLLTIFKFIIFNSAYSTRAFLILFFVVLVLNIKKIFKMPALFLLILIFAQILLKIIAQIITPNPLLWELGTAFDRQILPLIPVGLFVCGMLSFKPEVPANIVITKTN